MKRNEIPQKPETQKEQISTLWDIVCNHLFTKVNTHDIKINFILIFVGLILALLGVLIFRV